MIDKDPSQPLTEAHKAFASDLVKLARKHGADDLKVEFRISGPAVMRDWSKYDPARVSFSWHTGRHGAKSSYTIRAEASLTVEESNDPI